MIGSKQQTVTKTLMNLPGIYQQNEEALASQRDMLAGVAPLLKLQRSRVLAVLLDKQQTANSPQYYSSNIVYTAPLRTKLSSQI
jgi:hypothetical protein